MELELIRVPSNSAGTLDGVARAPAALRRAGLAAALARAGRVHDAGDLPLQAPGPERDPASGLIGPGALAELIGAVRRVTRQALAAGRFPVVVGGDCPLLLGCLAAAMDVHGRSGLLFVDGHEDAWPPRRSTTGEAADAELGLAIGRDGDDLPPDLAGLLPLVAPGDVVLLGPRDAGELRDAGVPSLAGVVELHDADAVLAAGAGSLAAAAAARLRDRPGAWWFHVDLDVLATGALAAVDYRQPGGLGWEDLEAVTAAAVATPGPVGFDVTIYNPDLDPDGAAARRIAAYLGAAAAGLAAARA